MGTRNSFTLYSYLYEEQLALQSYFWYCLNCLWICTSASKTLIFTSCSYTFCVSLNNWCGNRLTAYRYATHLHSEIMVISNNKRKKNQQNIVLEANVVMLPILCSQSSEKPPCNKPIPTLTSLGVLHEETTKALIDWDL